MSEALLELLKGKDIDLSSTATTAQSPEVIEMLRSRQKEQDVNMALAGASGALGEFLFGGGGSIAEAGSSMAQGFMKRKHSLEDQETKGLMASLKGRTPQTKYQSIPLINPKTGHRTMGRFEQSSGTLTTQKGEPAEGYIKDYKANTFTDETTGRQYYLDSAGNKKFIGDMPEGAIENPKAREYVQKAKSEYNASMKKNDELIADLNKAMSNLDSGNLGTKAGAMSIIKGIEGRMTDEDRKFYLEPYGWWARFKRDVKNLRNPNLPDDIKEQAREVLDNLLKMTPKYGHFLRDKYSNQVSKTKLVSYGRVYDELGGGFPAMKSKQAGDGTFDSMTDEQLKQMFLKLQKEMTGK